MGAGGGGGGPRLVWTEARTRGEGSGREEEAEEAARGRETALSAASRDQLTDKYLIRTFTNSHLSGAPTSLPAPMSRKEGLFSICSFSAPPPHPLPCIPQD